MGYDSCWLAFQDLLSRLLDSVIDWVKSQNDICGLALVGSHARHVARPDSDIDLVVLSTCPSRFRDAGWLNAIKWSRAGFQLNEWIDEEYGAVWSRRARLRPECEIEFAFAALSWADVSPVDQGTCRVISDGCRILYDPQALLERLMLACR